VRPIDSAGRPSERESAYLEFVSSIDAALRRALVARFGAERGTEAYCEALVFAWEHWDRVRVMERPIPYLFTVGRSRTRRMFSTRPTFVAPPGIADERQVEPKLAKALEGLSGKQRAAVVLVVAYGWSYAEVAEVMHVQKGTVQRHVDRGMGALRAVLGVKGDGCG
jgi:DNA-directed RNA polymerase specialized sigma24 family protein